MKECLGKGVVVFVDIVLVLSNVIILMEFVWMGVLVDMKVNFV